jgi:hypothetical protein
MADDQQPIDEHQAVRVVEVLVAASFLDGPSEGT